MLTLICFSYSEFSPEAMTLSKTNVNMDPHEGIIKKIICSQRSYA